MMTSRKTLTYNLAMNLKSFAMAKNISQQDLAYMTSMNKSKVARIMNQASIDHCLIKDVFAIIDALGFKANALPDLCGGVMAFEDLAKYF